MVQRIAPHPFAECCALLPGNFDNGFSHRGQYLITPEGVSQCIYNRLLSAGREINFENLKIS